MKRPRILIVDDSSVMRKIVERSLRQAGLDLGDVVEAGNGIEALAAVREGAFDLILSDINMPAMDGLEFLRELSTIEGAKGTPVVMVTTEGSDSRVVEALSIGARGYIRKPFTPDQIKERAPSPSADPRWCRYPLPTALPVRVSAAWGRKIPRAAKSSPRNSAAGRRERAGEIVRFVQAPAHPVRERPISRRSRVKSRCPERFR
jgi:two-component system chemotaxis response regulator CheY